MRTSPHGEVFFVFFLLYVTIHLLMVRMCDKVNISLVIKMATNKING
jgi:hypothetical protein